MSITEVIDYLLKYKFLPKCYEVFAGETIGFGYLEYLMAADLYSTTEVRNEI